MSRLLKRGLEEEGHAVDLAGDGPEGLWLATENPYAAIVLDVMLPGFDGFELCRKLRAAGIWTPVLMLTARDAVDDRVRGLDAGAGVVLYFVGAIIAHLRRHDVKGTPVPMFFLIWAAGALSLLLVASS